MFWLILKIMSVFIAGLYISALLKVVFYEFKMERVYREKKSAMERLKKMPISMAVAEAKAFKIEQDYRTMVGILHKRQKGILRKMPYFRRAYL